MDFVQTTIFDSPVVIPYTQLDNDGKVYCKIDWVTLMFFDCCMNDILDWLHCTDLVSDFALGFFERCRGYDQRFIFTHSGLTLDCSAFDFYGENVDVTLFDVVVPKIRLEISGSGLDFLRSRGIDIDNYIRQPIPLNDNADYHFTRVDFAYDFINYCPEFIDKLLNYIAENQLPSGRVPIVNMTGGITCRVVTGGQKTVYLGSQQSDRMLRIYDKRLEQLDKRTMTYQKPNPYGDPESWFRIEWQTRNKFANELTIGTDHLGRMHDFKTILKDIFNRYAFAEGLSGDMYRNHIKPVAFWQDLFNWDDLERRIIQNAKYVELRDPQSEFIQRYEITHLRNQILYESLTTFEHREEVKKKYVDSLYEQDPVSVRRYGSFINKLNYLNVRVTDCSDGLFNNCGRLAWRTKK